MTSVDSHRRAWFGGALAPFGAPVFRKLWLASLGSNFGTLIQTVGAAWLMTTLVHSSDMVAFVQAATALPIMLLSVLGIYLVIDSFIHLKMDKLMPPLVTDQLTSLARTGRFGELLTFSKASDCVISRIVGSGLAQGSFGLPAVRQAMQEQGIKEVTRLNQRVGYLGFLGSIGPMLGLLGTVAGMIGSFNVLGSSKGAARPDELASGISLALVTTCMGLVLAIPLMFFHNYFRDRVTRLGQESSGVCERILQIMTTVIDTRNAAKAAPASAASHALATPAPPADPFATQAGAQA